MNIYIDLSIYIYLSTCSDAGRSQSLFENARDNMGLSQFTSDTGPYEIFTQLNLYMGHTAIIVNASARPPRLAGLPSVGTCNYRSTGI